VFQLDHVPKPVNDSLSSYVHVCAKTWNCPPLITADGVPWMQPGTGTEPLCVHDTRFHWNQCMFVSLPRVKTSSEPAPGVTTSGVDVVVPLPPSCSGPPQLPFTYQRCCNVLFAPCQKTSMRPEPHEIDAGADCIEPPRFSHPDVAPGPNRW
jgi:hypothetical protein